MRIKNKTRFDTKHLQRLMRAICKASGYDEPIECVFEYSRGNYWHGLGTYGARWIKIFIPRVETFSGKDCADLIIHELRHNTGLSHEDMYDNTDAIDLSEVNELVVCNRPEKSKPTMDEIKKKRYIKVLDSINYDEKLVKRAKNRLKKLYKKKRYYERCSL